MLKNHDKTSEAFHVEGNGLLLISSIQVKSLARSGSKSLSSLLTALGFLFKFGRNYLRGLRFNRLFASKWTERTDWPCPAKFFHRMKTRPVMCKHSLTLSDYQPLRWQWSCLTAGTKSDLQKCLLKPGKRESWSRSFYGGISIVMSSSIHVSLSEKTVNDIYLRTSTSVRAWRVVTIFAVFTDGWILSTFVNI